MGLYDYVGKHGDQVKCFALPCFSVKRYNNETKKSECSFHVVGGRLANANNAPYATPYYNYGKDFAILDYRWYESEAPKVHFFRDGKWVRTAYCDKVSLRYNYPPVTIDYYGERINVKSVKEMRAFIADFIETDKMQNQMLHDGLEAVNLSYKLNSKDYYLSIGQDAMVAEFQLRDQIHNDVYSKTFASFNQKWINRDHESELDIIGMLVYDYMDERAEKRDGYRDTHRLEYEWYMLFAGAIEQLKYQFENPVESYFDWCDKEGIIVDKEFVKALFEKYTKTPSEQIITEYEKYWDSLYDWQKKF